MESEDMEDIIGEPVWNVEDKDRGMIDLKLCGNIKTYSVFESIR